jgi:hypothetical protein
MYYLNEPTHALKSAFSSLLDPLYAKIISYEEFLLLDFKMITIIMCIH